MTQTTLNPAVKLDELAATLRSAALDVLWAQWAAVGGSAASNRVARAIIDPEALVLLSLALIDDEGRLADIVHDWTVLNAHLLSVQRLKNLASDYPCDTRDRLSWLARVAVREARDIRWRSLVARDPDRLSSAAPDPQVRTNKRRAVRFRPGTPATIALRLRLAFGVGAKADILAVLLGVGGDGLTIREIAAATGYTAAATRKASDDMAAAELLHVRDGQPARFRAETSKWRDILGVGGTAPGWGYWRERFAFVVAFLAWVDEARDRPLTTFVVGVKGREVMDRHKAAFEHDRVVSWSEHTRLPLDDSFLDDSVRALATWMLDHV